jgi:hypothetical protein
MLLGLAHWSICVRTVCRRAGRSRPVRLVHYTCPGQLKRGLFAIRSDRSRIPRLDGDHLACSLATISDRVDSSSTIATSDPYEVSVCKFQSHDLLDSSSPGWLGLKYLRSAGLSDPPIRSPQ